MVFLQFEMLSIYLIDLIHLNNFDILIRNNLDVQDIILKVHQSDIV